MEYEHHCDFCGWRRDAITLTMLRPHCEQCGCVLEARVRPLIGETREWRMPALPGRVVVSLAVVGLLPVAAFAAKAGYELAGTGMAILAAVLALLMAYIVAAPTGARR